MTSKRIKLSVLIAIICLFAFSAFSFFVYQRLTQLVEYTHLVNKTNNFVLELQEVILLHIDAETGVRGYLLTQDTLFLEPYNKAAKAIPSLLLELYKSSGGRKSPIFNQLGIIRSISNEKFDSIFKPLIKNARLHKNLDSIHQQLVLLENGKIKMDSIREIVRSIKDNQEFLLKNQTASQNEFSQLSPIYFIYVISVALLILLSAITVIINQVIEMLKYQRELERKILEINQTNEQLDQYSYTLTHHLQEPLRKIRLFVSLFGHKNKTVIESNLESGTILNKIKDLAVGVQGQLDEFLQFVRLNHRSETEYKVVDLNPVIHEILFEKQEIINRLHATIRADVMPVISHANPAQMKLLFDRLIDNALKFQPVTNITERIPKIILTATKMSVKNISEIKIDKDDETIFYEFNVTDNGIGFDNRFSDKVFNLFERLHIDEGYSGMGLGLTLVKRIVQLHHGFIKVRSKINEGTTFQIYLPA